jgi:hypothetical protein
LLSIVAAVYPSVSAAVNRRGGETDLRTLQTCAHSRLAVDREPRGWRMIRKSMPSGRDPMGW